MYLVVDLSRKPGNPKVSYFLNSVTSKTTNDVVVRWTLKSRPISRKLRLERYLFGFGAIQELLLLLLNQDHVLQMRLGMRL